MKKTYKVLCALLIGTMSANAITKTWSGNGLNSVQDGAFITTGNHIGFSITPDQGSIVFDKGLMSSSNKLILGQIQNGNLSFGLSWECNVGSTMKVTKISASVLMENSTATDKCKIGEGKVVDLNGFYSTVSYTNADGIESGVKLTLDRSGASKKMGLWMNSITLEYSLIPDAPVLGEMKETSVDVTIDEANPNYVDLAGLFSAQDHYGDYLAYECGEENGIIDNGKFYATAAGVYHVKAYVAALKNCHDQSEKSEEEFTITVNRIDPTLEVLKADSAISVTVNEDNIYSVAMLDMLNYVGDGLAFEVTEGEAANLVLADSAVYALMAGDYTIAISSVESARYNASAEAVYINIHATAAQSQIETVLSESNILAIDSMIENVFVFADTLGMQIIVEPEGVIAYDATANTLTAIAKGEATLTLSQPEIPGVIEAYEAVYTFIVMDDTPTALFNIKHAGKVSKMLNNGKLVIIRDGKVHNALGVRIR